MKVRKILLIDDERILNESLSDLIHALGHEVSAFFSIREAKESVDFSTLDMIICDVGLPGESAFGFVKWVKKDFNHLSCVMLSAFSEKEIIDRSIAVGADSYLVKPPKLEELRRVCEQ